jgi:hypothetical protein
MAVEVEMDLADLWSRKSRKLMTLARTSTKDGRN